MKRVGMNETFGHFLRRFTPWLVLLLLGWSFRYYYFTYEDGWMSLRYARFFAEGHGLISRIGGAHEEGFSSLTWILLIGMVSKILSLDVITVSKIFGYGSFVGTLLVTRAIVRLSAKHLDVPDWKTGYVETFALLSIGLSDFFIYWSGSGLETPWYTLWVLISLYLFLRIWLEGKFSWLPLLSGTLFFLWLTRPDGVINAFVIAFLFCALPGRVPRAKIFPSIFLFLIFSTIFYFWKIYYFGDFFSAPSYVKLALRAFRVGMIPTGYLVSYLRHKGRLFSFSVGIIFVLALWTLYFRRERREMVLLLLTLLCFIASQIFQIVVTGGDWQGARFLLHNYPTLVLLVSILWLSYSQGRIQTAFFLLVFSVFVRSAVQKESLGYPNWWSNQFKSPYTAIEDTAQFAEAEKIRRSIAASGNPFWAHTEFGIIPFVLEFPGLDPCGLNDSPIARSFKLYPRDEVYYAARDYTLSFIPQIIGAQGLYRVRGTESGMVCGFSTYFESTFFRMHYQTEIPELESKPKHTVWNLFEFRNNYVPSRSINIGGPNDLLLHGFKNGGWVCPTARLLLTPDEEDSSFCLAGFLPSQAKVEVRINGHAIGDQIIGSREIKAGEFHECFSLPKPLPLARSKGLLITLFSSPSGLAPQVCGGKNASFRFISASFEKNVLVSALH